ncbi:amidase [Sediminibacterium salmoneum]|uniref:amidase n=1 Tax=Sediminibacterium salmoneum TaxID=426421 RepID=UPI000478AA3A|nr:amidase [Sediminibacterium salmoneum]
MNRRKFLRSGSLAAAAAVTVAGTAASGLAGCSGGSNPTEEKKRDSAEIAAAEIGRDEFELSEITIAELQQGLQSGKYSSVKLAELYLTRISEIDQGRHDLKSVIEVNPEALLLAEQMDKERKQGKLRGPLHGIPIMIKDNIDTADKMHTTAGSIALADHIAAKDAFVVAQLRKAGALIIGKTNLSEWANFRSTRSSSGWSSRGGQTRNPYVINRSPCGSSSGSAVAVSANLCAVAVGTETDGSVIAPASFCGIVGIKPTVGLVSRSGIIPISATQDTAGPMTRTVADAALLLNAMVGVDPADSVTLNAKDKIAKDYTSFLDKNALKGKRIGVEQSFLKGRQEEVVALYQKTIDQLKQLGATIVPVELVKETGPLGEAEFQVLLYEFKDGLNKYLSGVKKGVKSMSELIEFNKKNAEVAMRYFKQELVEMSNAKGDLKSSEYLQAVAKSTSARAIIDRTLKTNQLDAIVGTSYGPAHCIDWVNGDDDPGFYFCPPAAMAGYPHITVPMGDIHGLPVGLSFIASAFEEGKIIGLAYAYEQASKQRKVPHFKRSI